MSAASILNHAAKVLDERRSDYGDPLEQFRAVAERWSLTLGTPVTADQVVLCMIDLKLTRLGFDPLHTDSLVDVIGYAALLKEVR